MLELLRTNDLVIISVVESLLKGEGIGFYLADQHMSAMEGSLGFLPRRLLVEAAQFERARALLAAAGLGQELRDA